MLDQSCVYEICIYLLDVRPLLCVNKTFSSVKHEDILFWRQHIPLDDIFTLSNPPLSLLYKYIQNTTPTIIYNVPMFVAFENRLNISSVLEENMQSKRIDVIDYIINNYRINKMKLLQKAIAMSNTEVINYLVNFCE